MAAQRQITCCGFILAASVDGDPCWAFRTPFSVFNTSADHSGSDLQRIARYHYRDENPAVQDHRGRTKELSQADYPSRTSHAENRSVTPCRCPDSRKGVPFTVTAKTFSARDGISIIDRAIYSLAPTRMAIIIAFLYQPLTLDPILIHGSFSNPSSRPLPITPLCPPGCRCGCPNYATTKPRKNRSGCSPLAQ